MTRIHQKDPAAVLDYPFDWSAWLDTGETISDYSVTVDDGLTLASVAEADGIVVPWLSGGTVDENYDVVCQITTSAGRTDERTMQIRVRER